MSIALKEKRLDNDLGYIEMTRPDWSIAELKNIINEYGVKDVTLEDLTMMAVPDSYSTGDAVVWIAEYVDLCGHHPPAGTTNIIEIENVAKTELYEAYKHTILWHSEAPPLSITQFYGLFNTVFPHVKRKKYKSVGHKCDTCAILCGLRQRFDDRERKEMVSHLHAFHRRTYMSQRYCYYRRRAHAVSNPTKVWSFIVDGMQQDHCNLPHRGYDNIYICYTI